MIKWFRFKNFESYRNDCLVDLTVNKKVAHSYFDHEMADGSKVAKVLGVFGANGSGKSNLLQPLAFASWFIAHSFKEMEDDEKLPYFPHFAAQDQNSEIEVSFYIPTEIDIEFNYFIEFNKHRAIRETLKVKTSRLFTSLFDRRYNEEKSQYIVKKNNQTLPTTKHILEQTPQNCSLISYVSRLSDKKFNETNVVSIVATVFGMNDSNLSSSGRRSEVYNLNEVTKLFADHDEIFSIVKGLLQKYDLGLDDIVIEETTVLTADGEEESRLMPFCIHNHQGKPYRLPLHRESSGTQSAYKMLASIALRLKQGGISVLDEFDNDLHPQLTAEIINLFKDESTNPKNAQLIFTSHSPEILKLLRKQHVYLTEKSDCESEAWRADDIEGLKERDNLYAKYISGALGGVPSFA